MQDLMDRWFATLMMLLVLAVVILGVVTLICAPRHEVISTHQCTATMRVADVQVSGHERHYEVQVWDCANGVCAYWTTATYDRREEAMVYCHGGEEIKV